MSRRCYILLYEKLTTQESNLIIPIKSTKIGSAYGGMPQFFGGGALDNETHLETIKRELYEEGLGYLYLKDKPFISLIYKSTLKKNNIRIDFFFYASNDFTYKIKTFPLTLPQNGEMSSILAFKSSHNKSNTPYDICKRFNINPSNHFQKSETFTALRIALDKLGDQQL